MNKKRYLIVIISCLGGCVGAFNIFIGLSNKNNDFFLAVGLLFVVLSLGIYMCMNWARIAMLCACYLFLAHYILLMIITAYGAFNSFGGIGMIINLPGLIASLIFIFTLNGKSVKIQFVR